MHTPRAAVVGLAVLGGCLAGPGFTTCPKTTPCYDQRMQKCKVGDATLTNGAGLVYCDASLTGICDDKTVCYDFASGCVCEGSLPCHKFNNICQAWTEECTPKNVYLQWCPTSSLPPVVTTPVPTTTTPPPVPTTTTSPPVPTTTTPPPVPTTSLPSPSSTASSPSAGPSAVTTLPSPASANASGTTKESSSAMIIPPGNDAGPNNTIVIVAAIGGVVVLVAVIAAFVILRRRRHQRPPYAASAYASVNNATPQNPGANRERPYAATPFVSTAQKLKTQPRKNAPTMMSTFTSNPAARSLHGQGGSSNAFDMSELDLHRIAPQELDLVKVEASGGYGEVLLAEYQGRSVAVKRLLPSKRSTRTEVAKYIDEIKLHAKMDCPYIVAFVGAAWSKPSDIMMVTEFMENGDLRGLLQQTTPQTFEWAAKVENALEIANALVYLHTLVPSVIHRDLKSRNVLINKAFQCKLTDFGVSREFYDMETMTAGVGTYRWMAPEVLQDGHYAASADIFSFGVILAELDTHLLPYEGVVNDRGNPLTDTAIMAKVMNGELRPSFSATCPRWFSDLGSKCLSLNPSDRPTAMQIAFMVKEQMRSGSL